MQNYSPIFQHNPFHLKGKILSGGQTKHANMFVPTRKKFQNELLYVDAGSCCSKVHWMLQ